MTAGKEAIATADWPVAILAGGLAQRLRPITEKIPKALVNVGGLPFLAHQLRLVRLAGLPRVVVCAGYLGEMIEKEFGDGRSFGVEIEYSFDKPSLLGTGGALKRALPVLGPHFFVLYGDSYLPIDYREVLAAFLTADKAGLMTVFRNENRWDTSNVQFESSTILGYDKKQPSSEMHHIDYGLGILRAESLSSFPEDKPFDLSEVYLRLLSENQLAGYEVSERFYEIGSPKGLAELEAYFRDSKSAGL